MSTYLKHWRQKNKAHLRNYMRRWRAAHPEKVEEQRRKRAERTRKIITVDLGGGVLVKDTREHLVEIGALEI